MSLAGDALAGLLRDHYSRRSQAASGIRLLVSGYPQRVLTDSLIHLIGLAEGTRDGRLQLPTSGGTVELSIALLQPQGTSRQDLLTVDGYVFGAAPDHAVSLRNRGGNVLIAVPPALWEQISESLKANSFQRFHEARHGGADARLFQKIASDLFPTELAAEAGRALRTLRREALASGGEEGDCEFFDRLESFAAEIRAGSAVDWRKMRLLPPFAMELEAAARAPKTGGALKAVQQNLRFQQDLVEGLASLQYGFIQKKYGQAATFDLLVSYLARWRFLLDPHDDEWRREWPLGLPIDALLSVSPTSAEFRVSSLELASDALVLGVPVIRGDLSAVWQLKPRKAHAGMVSVDGEQVEAMNLAIGHASVSLDLAPGFHDLALVSSAGRLTGTTGLNFLVPGGTPHVIISVANAPGGSSPVRVERESRFLVQWAVYPETATESVTLRTRVASDSDGESALQERQLAPDARSFEFEGGISGAVELELYVVLAGGRTLVAGADIEPIDAADERPDSVPSVAHGILRFAEQSRGQAFRNEDVIAETTIGGFRLHGVGVTTDQSDSEIGANQDPEFSIDAPSLLAAMEEQLLLGDLPRPHVIGRVSRKRGAFWRAIPSTAVDDYWGSSGSPERQSFLRARRDAMRVIADQGGIRRCMLSSQHESREIFRLIREYLAAYVQFLTTLTLVETQFDSAHVAAALVDCVLVPRHPVKLKEGDRDALETPLDLIESGAVLVSPLHPVRLAWLAARERWYRDLATSDGDWSPQAARALEARDFPPVLVDRRFSHFHAVATAGGGLWGVYAPEAHLDLDAVLDSRLRDELGVFSAEGGSTSDSAVASPEQIARAVRQYQQLHPYKSGITIDYLNAGSGHSIREALRLLLRPPTNSTEGVSNYTTASGSYGYEVRLLATEADSALQMGAAFRAGGTDEEQEVPPERVIVSVSELGTLSTGGATRPSHLLFGAEVFALRGKTLPISGLDGKPTMGGLSIPRRRTVERGDFDRVLSHALLGRPSNWGEDPSEWPLSSLIHSALFALQSIGAASEEQPVTSLTQGRVLVTELKSSDSVLIDDMHSRADWVFLMDSHVDVEYFDDPRRADRYVIDYVPRLVASGESVTRHNYVLTTARAGAVESAINRFLYAAYPREHLPEGAARRLARALNRVSGRLLLKVVDQPSAAKGAVGMGLLQLMYETGSSAVGVVGTDSMRVLIPMDDYVEGWLKELSSIVGGAHERQRADVLDLLVTLRDEDVLLTPRVLEIKNRRETYSPSQVVEGPGRQVVASARHLDGLFGLLNGSRRLDQEVKNLQLAQLLDYHLRRVAMQHADDVPGGFAREFRSRVYQRVANGDYVSSWQDTVSQVGEVVHFNPESDLVHHVSDHRTDNFVLSYRMVGAEGIAALLDGNSLPPASSGPRSSSAPADESAPNSPINGSRESGTTGQPSQGVSGSGAPDDRPTWRLEEFEGYIGNAEALRRLAPWVIVARRSTPPRLPENIALTGPASTGKTELSRRIARALGLPFLPVTGAALKSLDDLLDKMKQQASEIGQPMREVERFGGLPVLLAPPMIVFVDEAHELSNAVQNQLLTLLEPQDRKGEGKHFWIDAKDVTFVVATTEWGELLHTLQTRLQRVELRPYSLEEVTEIIGGKFPQLEHEVRRRLAVAGRLVPRIALQKAGEFDNALTAYSADPEALLDEYFSLWQIDSLGISEADREYLRVLDRNSKAVGLSSLSNQLGRPEKEIARNLEPYLLSLGFISITQGGRLLREPGRRYLVTLGG